MENQIKHEKNSFASKVNEFIDAVKDDLENPIVKLAIEALNAGFLELQESAKNTKIMVETSEKLNEQLSKAVEIIEAQEKQIKSAGGSETK